MTRYIAVMLLAFLCGCRAVPAPPIYECGNSCVVDYYHGPVPQVVSCAAYPNSEVCDCLQRCEREHSVLGLSVGVGM